MTTMASALATTTSAKTSSGLLLDDHTMSQYETRCHHYPNYLSLWLNNNNNNNNHNNLNNNNEGDENINENNNNTIEKERRHYWQESFDFLTTTVDRIWIIWRKENLLHHSQDSNFILSQWQLEEIWQRQTQSKADSIYLFIHSSMRLTGAQLSRLHGYDNSRLLSSSPPPPPPPPPPQYVTTTTAHCHRSTAWSSTTVARDHHHHHHQHHHQHQLINGDSRRHAHAKVRMDR